LNNKHAAKNPVKGDLLRKIRTVILILILIATLVGCGVLVGMFAAVSKEMNDMNFKNAAMNFSSFLYYTDENGNSYELDHVFDDGNRIWVDSGEIPKQMKEAIISIEDERFYSHHGVDVKRTAGAFVKWGLAKVGLGQSSYGGSTITQQLIKNITNEKDKSATRKLKEIMRAVVLEKQMTKDEILTMYLNVVFFANNCYGVQAASNAYFDKDVSELTLAETAAIAGITQRPSAFDPFKYPDKTVEKRNLVLGKMLELEKISQAEYDQAVNEKMVVNTNYKAKQGNISSYFVDQVINDVTNDLQNKKGYSESFAKQQVYNGGLKIYTTLDPDIQDAVENTFTNTSNFPKTSSKTQAQASMIVTDPFTGEVKGIVGGLGKKTDSRGLNRATQTKRQPGSSIKPLSVYAPAFEENKITASSILKDEPVTIGNWSPKNSYSGFKGDLSVRNALAISSNITAVKTVQDVGIENSYNFLKNKLHFSSIDPKDKNVSPLGLGGLTNGVSAEEMAAAYGMFVNGGKYIAPYTYTKVVDNTGRVLLENKPTESQVIDERNAYIMADLLSSVVNASNGTARNAKLSKMPTYGKTGTTNDDYDKWFVGFTPYYVGAVWYGFDKPQSIRSVGVKSNPATAAWKKVMEQVHKNLDVKELPVPSGVVTEKVCTVTGKKASSSCPSSTEYFVRGTQPKSTCSSKHASSGGDSSSKDPNKNTEDSEYSEDEKATPTSSPTATKNPAKPTATPSEPDAQKTPKPTATPTKSPKPDTGSSQGNDDVIDLE
jgi:penicillin-binding protein 1A